MFNSNQIEKSSDSIIGLLAAQCVDLEKLLTLAREETIAAEQSNFAKIIEIVSERAELARRLETVQQQISHLRETLGTHPTGSASDGVTARVLEIANLTLVQDQKTKLLLTAARDEASDSLHNLDKSQRGTNAYLQSGSKGLAYNRNF